MDEKRKELVSHLKQTRVILRQRQISIKHDLFARFEVYCEYDIPFEDFKTDAETLADAYRGLGYAIESLSKFVKRETK